MLVALLIYGYSLGMQASRQLVRDFEERTVMMAVTGLNTPDFRSISTSRRRHLLALRGLFAQVLAPAGTHPRSEGAAGSRGPRQSWLSIARGFWRYRPCH
ncbi:MAG: transposase [Roseomonas sp.]|nr:transposase [Roseomonas sp.]